MQNSLDIWAPIIRFHCISFVATMLTDFIKGAGVCIQYCCVNSTKLSPPKSWHSMLFLWISPGGDVRGWWRRWRYRYQRALSCRWPQFSCTSNTFRNIFKIPWRSGAHGKGRQPSPLYTYNGATSLKIETTFQVGLKLVCAQLHKEISKGLRQQPWTYTNIKAQKQTERKKYIYRLGTFATEKSTSARYTAPELNTAVYSIFFFQNSIHALTKIVE